MAFAPYRKALGVILSTATRRGSEKILQSLFARRAERVDEEPRVKIVVRDPRGERLRTADQFPLPTTKMIRYYLDTKTKSLASTKPLEEGEIAYDALGPGVDFSTEPFTEDVEFTGFVSRISAMSSTDDMDIFGGSESPRSRRRRVHHRRRAREGAGIARLAAAFTPKNRPREK